MQIKKNAAAIVRHGWRPAFFMIDKSAAERAVILMGEILHYNAMIPQYA